jgi:hypothetical protein
VSISVHIPFVWPLAPIGTLCRVGVVHSLLPEVADQPLSNPALDLSSRSEPLVYTHMFAVAGKSVLSIIMRYGIVIFATVFITSSSIVPGKFCLSHLKWPILDLLLGIHTTSCNSPSRRKVPRAHSLIRRCRGGRS